MGRKVYSSSMNKMQKIFWIFFSIIAIMVFVGIGFSIWATVEIVNVIQTEGLKGAVEVLMNGAQQSSGL
ncbi:periplasmic protein [Enterobacter phage CC31]|uniref:Uncharacterized protein n=1 Tax=Enterobacter phage CC31 TaxID=709484 RepID=E5DI07_9CAUD|nr:periplasmic protein [Enterobacter phage CC31]ADB81771.1 hypothetical protein CC31p275 [Enterobacter phage CC31]